jgi:hypothetical protein
VFAQQKAKKKADTVERKETRQRKAALKTKADWHKDCQKAFNAFIRERDYGNACISCGKHHPGQNHAGHYRSVGSAAELRYCEDQVFLQCAPCNNHLSGNLINYRINLVEKIGRERVEWIEGKHEPKKYTIDQLQAMTKHYRAKTKQLRDSR